MGITLERIIVRHIRMPLVHFFETSFERIHSRDMLLVEAVSCGTSGWGEVTCGENPFYNEEWTESAWLMLKDYIAPRVLRHEFDCADQVYPRLAHIRGHYMARGGIEAAVWDLEARRAGVPLWKFIGGGARREIACGVSIGIQDTLDQLLHKIDIEVSAGYQRIKMKIKPGWDIDIVREVRKRFPSVGLMADANSAYRLTDIERLKCLDAFGLMMIEQPLAHDEIIDHVELQQALQTPICLDECIRNPHQAEQAIRLGACRIINIKLGRVGGFWGARRIHDIAQEHGVPVWCGGMLESGIGRAHNIALSTLPNFILPGDVSASKRYWQRDIVVPPVEVTGQGTIPVRDDRGFGYPLDMDFLRQVTVREMELT